MPSLSSLSRWVLRNSPIAAAMSAHGFVQTAVKEMATTTSSSSTPAASTELDDEGEEASRQPEQSVVPATNATQSIQEDVQIIGSSLSFIDEFLR